MPTRSLLRGRSKLVLLGTVTALALCQRRALASSFTMSGANKTGKVVVDSQYPGTAVARLNAIHGRIAALPSDALSGDWEDVRRVILQVGGLGDISDRRRVGTGYTGHSFNDYNHCDLTPMLLGSADNTNDGKVQGIALGNALGDGIRKASLPLDSADDGLSGSWSTCMQGCSAQPEPRDVAHLQFRARIAFKLVWCPPLFERFVLVDDDGKLLKVSGSLSGNLPHISEREMNFRLVAGSKYAIEATALSDERSEL